MMFHLVLAPDRELIDPTPMSIEANSLREAKDIYAKAQGLIGPNWSPEFQLYWGLPIKQIPKAAVGISASELPGFLKGYEAGKETT